MMRNVSLGLGVSPKSGVPWYANTNMSLNGAAPSLVHDYLGQRFYNTVSGPSASPFGSIRASNATMFDSAGNLVYAPANMLQYSDDLTNAIWTKTDSTITADTETAPSGALADLVTEGVAGTALVQQQVTGLAANAPFVYSVELKRGNTDWVRVFFGTGGNTNQTWFNLGTGAVGTTTLAGTATAPLAASITNLGGGWYRCVVSIANVNATSLTALTVSAASDASTTRVNNATRTEGRHQWELYDISAPHVPMIQTTSAAFFGARFDTDPATLSPRGLLIEEARTNSTFNSAMVGGVGGSPGTAPGNWSFSAVTGVTVTTSYGTENGVPYVDITYSGTNTSGADAFPTIFLGATASNIAAANGQTWTGAMRIRKVGGADAANAWAMVVRGRNAGSLVGGQSASTAVSAGATTFGNSLQSATFTYSATVTHTEFVLTRTITNGAAVDITYRISCVQHEQGAQPSSHIPTFGTAATRAIDNPVLATAAWLAAGTGTLYLEYVLPTQANGSFPHMFQIDDGTTNNRVQMYAAAGASNASNGMRVDDAGVNQVNTSSSPAVNYNTIVKSALAYATNNTRTVCNNGTVAQDVTCTIPATLNTYRPGSTVGGGSGLKWLRSARYYAAATASDAQLKALTT